MNAQLPAALAHWIAGQGDEADHIADVRLLDEIRTDIVAPVRITTTN
jgi:hypothetical protein